MPDGSVARTDVVIREPRTSHVLLAGEIDVIVGPAASTTTVSVRVDSLPARSQARASTFAVRAVATKAEVRMLPEMGEVVPGSAGPGRACTSPPSTRNSSRLTPVASENGKSIWVQPF